MHHHYNIDIGQMTKFNHMSDSHAGEKVDVGLFDQRLTSERILAAALASVVDDGIAATTTRSIAARANVRQGVIHYHFATKDALLLALLRHLFENSMRIIGLIDASPNGPVRKLEMVIATGFSLIGPRGREFTAYIALWAHAMACKGQWQKTYQNLFYTFRNTMVGIVQEGTRQKIFRKVDPEIIVAAIVAQIHGLGIQSVIDPECVDLETAQKEMTAATLKMLSVDS